MTSVSRFLAAAGALIAGPAFILNVMAHDGVMPGPDEVDRTDGVFSLMFMAGAFLVVAALILVQPSPLGRKGRWLLYVEGVMVMLGAMWATFVIADPQGTSDSNNPIVLIGDACWPLHQVFMLVVGITAVRAGRWSSPERFTLFGPTIGLLLLGLGVATGFDFIAAAGIGAGWMIAAAGVLCVTSRNDQALEKDQWPELALIA